MIRRFNNVECRQRPELLADRTQQLEIGKRVPGSLEEQHRRRNLREVVCAFGSRPVGRV